MLIRTNRGLLVEDEPGQPLRLLCNEALSVASTEVAPLALTDDGVPFLSTYAAGLIRVEENLCEWHPVAGPWAASSQAFDLAMTSGVSPSLYLLAGPSGLPPGLFTSRDRAISWSMSPPDEIFFTKLAVAASDSNRIYRTGIAQDPSAQITHWLSVSEDGGATSAHHLLSLGPNVLQAQALAVDPTDPQIVYVKAESSSDELPDALLRSDDGGQTLDTVLSLKGFNGFALAPDGQTVWAGGTDGIWRSTDGGSHFTPLPADGPNHITCLAVHDDQLFACGVFGDELSVGASRDGGRSFSKVVSFSAVSSLVSCPASAQVDEACRGALVHWRFDLGIGAAGGASAGAAGAPSGATGGGGTGGGESPGGAVGAGEPATPMSAGRAGGCSVVGANEATPAALLAGILLIIASKKVPREMPRRRTRS